MRDTLRVRRLRTHTRGHWSSQRLMHAQPSADLPVRHPTTSSSTIDFARRSRRVSSTNTCAASRNLTPELYMYVESVHRLSDDAAVVYSCGARNLAGRLHGRVADRRRLDDRRRQG